jgi:hypothetical protein
MWWFVRRTTTSQLSTCWTSDVKKKNIPLDWKCFFLFFDLTPLLGDGVNTVHKGRAELSGDRFMATLLTSKNAERDCFTGSIFEAYERHC